jgi:hypothetical protein
MSNSAAGKGQHKAGRNKVVCERYERENRRAKSHMRRIIRHLSRHGGDDVAHAALAKYQHMAKYGSASLVKPKE